MRKADTTHTTDDAADDHAADTRPTITPFLFDGESLVRVIDRNGDPWFVATDVCNVLDIKNPTQAVAPLDADERSMFNIGRQGEAIVVSEGGLYTLVLRSHGATKPGTVGHRFRRWVTSEVLPAIRQTGRYQQQPESEIADDEPQSPDGLKLRKVNTAARCFGERAGAQLWVKLGLDWVPAMAPALAQTDLLDLFSAQSPGSVVISVNPGGRTQ